MPIERPVYVGNYEYEMPENEIYKMFYAYGDIDRIDMKTGFCFVYMKDDREAERAIRKLDGREVGYKRRPLRVQWAKTKDADRKREIAPSTTLFVVNFDLARTRERDLERHFAEYGPIKRVEIKRSYAFVQFEDIEDAMYAMKKTNFSNLMGRTITVEYVQNEGGRRRERSLSPRPRSRSRSPRRSFSRSPPRRGSPSV
ncbi:hypothetical protein DUNSADRAFT_10060 [Dunaliella salina]|uniref:RRM domain-containing protein n=1 Tax=Dunaliella salina TaxID=3046 RepID=A0ABQ7GG33_DUNSA|nr:hypothetical protein DUNSADRAFT_10060 [Dunaliella salina]|eukprot:KAF5833569.1 hypothetical protein DUNSADRAFT_10060 [Dunaliella salina]